MLVFTEGIYAYIAAALARIDGIFAFHGRFGRGRLHGWCEGCVGGGRCSAAAARAAAAAGLPRGAPQRGIQKSDCWMERAETSRRARAVWDKWKGAVQIGVSTSRSEVCVCAVCVGGGGGRNR